MSKAKPWYHDRIRYDGKVPPPIEDTAGRPVPSKRKRVRLTYYIKQQSRYRWFSKWYDDSELEVRRVSKKFKHERAARQHLADEIKRAAWFQEKGQVYQIVNYKIEQL